LQIEWEGKKKLRDESESLVTKLVKILKDIKTTTAKVRSLVFPVATYASESWILNASCRRIDAFEMFCYKKNASTTKN